MLLDEEADAVAAVGHRVPLRLLDHLLAVTRRSVAMSSNQTSARPSTTVSGPDSTRETRYFRTSGNFFT